MKYSYYLTILSCLALISCSIEKKLYSPGYHIEWFHSNSKPQKIELHEESNATQIISASENSEILLISEVTPNLPIKQVLFLKDTVIPNNTNQSEEDYVTPNTINSQNSEPIDAKELRLSQKDEIKLSRLSKYLVASAIATIIPGIAIFYPVLLIINFFIIREIRSMAELSPYKTFYLNQIKRYWKIMLWPIYILAFAIYIFLIFMLK